MPKAIKFIVITLVVLFVLGQAKDFLVKAAVEGGARFVTGADVKIGSLSLGVFKQSVRIRDLKVYHPVGFPYEVMLDLPEITVVCDLPAILGGTLHLPYLRLDLKEVRVIRNKGGALNVNSLKFAQSPKGASSKKTAKAEPSAKAPAKDLAIRFDLVSLNIGRVVMEDYSVKGDKPKVTVYDVDIKNKEFKNVTNPAVLGAAVMFAALNPVGGLDGAFSLGAKAIDSAVGTVGGAAKTLEDTATGLFKGIKRSLE